MNAKRPCPVLFWVEVVVRVTVSVYPINRFFNVALNSQSVICCLYKIMGLLRGRSSQQIVRIGAYLGLCSQDSRYLSYAIIPGIMSHERVP